MIFFKSLSSSGTTPLRPASSSSCAASMLSLACTAATESIMPWKSATTLPRGSRALKAMVSRAPPPGSTCRMSTGGGFSMLPAVEGAAAGAAATGKGESVAVLSDLPWSSEPTKPKNDDCRTRCASRSVAVPSGEGECSGAGAGEDAGATASLLSSSGSSAGGGATVGRVPSEVSVSGTSFPSQTSLFLSQSSSLPAFEWNSLM
mmetsp:Transcript_22273/g.71982  ORF Transcript_22273/g.71982 Transcript_22273/m.71982 type:complete len:204 (-) Transcript_22273:1243-1854(-)